MKKFDLVVIVSSLVLLLSLAVSGCARQGSGTMSNGSMEATMDSMNEEKMGTDMNKSMDSIDEENMGADMDRSMDTMDAENMDRSMNDDMQKGMK